ncbi:MAG: amidohydrolase family protein, partial [FCB group bacterium]|nr:amidohydrolase family protein [FCB group bacterium]
MRKRKYFVSLVMLSVFFLRGQVAPVKGLHENPPRVWALTNGNVYTDPNTLIKGAAIVLRDGIIEAVGTDLDIPGDATEIDLNGNTVYAGFIESWLEIPDRDTIRTARDHWNKQVRADRIAFDSYKPDAKDVKQLRALGFTTAHLIPKNGIFRGQSSLVQLTDKPEVLKTTVAQTLDFKFGGWGSNEYPNSLLGCIALIRQTFLDADWYARATEIFREYPESNEPVKEDRALQALAEARRQKYPFIFNARDELYALRAGAIAREFGLELWLKGSGYEYRRLNDIKAFNPFIILPVNYPGKPDVSNPYQALQYTTEQLKHWDLAPDNAAKLVAADIPIAFTSAGLKNRTDFRKRLTKSVQRGLPPATALAALTTIPAKKMGVDDYLGQIKAGYQANLVIVDGDYFNYNDPIRSVWIGGDEYPVKPAPIVDPSGEWELELPETAWRLTFKKSGTGWKGSVAYDSISFTLKDVTIDADRVSWI